VLSVHRKIAGNIVTAWILTILSAGYKAQKDMTGKWKKYLYTNNKYRLVSEFIILYLFLPLAVMFKFIPLPLMVILLVMGITVHLYLYYDPAFNRKHLINWHTGKKEILRIILLFFPLAAMMVVMIWKIDETKLFYLPSTNPLFLLLISIFYPVFSVVPQGLAYRALFFHRYGSLFPGNTLKIVISAVLFSFGHILYKNAMVLLLTFFAGLIFGYRYYKTQSLMISILEHSLYGVWLFTCGLGYFFVSHFVQ
jgi:membrane protease YdiL (CAAX protease family)